MEPTEHNRRAFDAAYRRRTKRGGLPAIVKATLGDLTGKRVLHLQCGTGEATAELAELGAVVTAVDESEAVLDAAREQWPKVLWIHASANALPAELRRGRFDLVYSPEGVLAGVTDLEAWARGIDDALHEHGEFLMYDDHPVALCVDAFAALAVRLLQRGLLETRHDRDHAHPGGLPRRGARGVSGRAEAAGHVPAVRDSFVVVMEVSVDIDVGVHLHHLLKSACKRPLTETLERLGDLRRRNGKRWRRLDERSVETRRHHEHSTFERLRSVARTCP